MRPVRFCTLFALLITLVVGLAAACSTGGDSSSDDSAAEAQTPSSSSVPTDDDADDDADADVVVLSTGTLTIADVTYELAVNCYAPGAGEVLAIGLGTDPDSGGLVEAYVQAFVGSPYVGVRVGDGPLIESTFEGPLDLYLQDDVIRASAIRFVRDLDLESGSGTSVGFGAVEILCEYYDEEIPA